MEKWHGQASKEHGLPLVRWRRRERGTILRQDFSRFEFSVMGIPCLGLNGGPAFKHNEAFSFQVATADQAETDRYWNAIVGNGGEESACGWCKDKWGLSWQITPIALIKAITDPDPAAAKRAFDAMMQMEKIDIAAIEAARRG
jgi:predicted 3-demethylubiquinone-9 3-methyltransferase (glyoxalase superfamily)